MDTFDKITELLQENGMTQADLARGTGISTGLISQWKNRAQKPSADKLRLVADYFNVSLDYLLGKTDIKKSPELSEDDEMAELLNEFRDNPELRTLFSLTKKADPKKLRQYIDVIKALRGSNNGNGDY